MTRRFVEDPRLLALTLILLVVAGLSSLATIVKQEDPTITNGVATIVAPFPGAGAERVEALVTDVIEEELQELSEIQTFTSTSSDGVAVIAIELDENILGDSTGPAFSKVRDALADAATRLPRGAPPPLFDDQRFGAYTRIVALRWEAPGPPLRSVMRRWGEELADRLRGVEGTKSVRVFGAPPEEVLVETSPAALAAAGLSIDDVAQTLRRADAKVAAGVVRSDVSNVVVEVEGALDSLDRVREVSLRTGPRGATLRIDDVATVRRGIRSPASELAVADGAPAVFVAAQMAAGTPFDRWAPAAQARVDEVGAILPVELQTQLVFDQTTYTEARLDELALNLVMGLLVVALVLFLTLGARSAMVVALTLPLVSLVSIAVLRGLDVPIHQMSVTGLIVALGLVVDCAIVVVDAVRHGRLAGKSSLEAVVAASDRLWLPLLSSTVTTVLAFMPIMLLSGRVGEFVSTLGLSVIVAIVVSYAAAMTVVAAIAGRFLKPGEGERSGPLARLLRQGLSVPTLTRAFDRSIAASLRRPKLSMAAAMVVPVLGFVGAGSLPKQFFPPADRDQFHLELRLADAASVEDTSRARARVEAVLRAQPEVRHVHWVVGRSAPPFYYNLRQDQDGNPSYAQAQITVTSPEVVEELLPRLQDELDRAVPSAQVLVRELLQGPPVDAPIEYRLYGSDPDELRRLGEVLRERITRVSSVTHARATLTAGTPKLWVVPDEVQAQLVGLSLGDVARQLDTQLEGAVGGSILEGSEELPVRVRLAGLHRDAPGEVESTSLVAPGAPASGVPLSAIAQLELRPAMSGIPHRNGERVNVIRGYIDAGVFPETAFAELEAVLAADPIAVPPGYHLETGGDAEKRASAMTDLFTYVPVLIVLMVAAIALSLASFRLGAVIVAVALASVGLGMFSLVVMRAPLGFNAMIGLIGLVGVAVNDAIVIATTLREDRRAAAGDVDAIRGLVVGETSRHVISTTVTTFGGFLPLILAGGRFWPPFASGIAGGVLLSTFVAFYFVPAAFLVVTRRRPVTTLVPELAS